MTRLLLLFATVLALGATTPTFAIDPDEQLDDPVLEARARNLSRQLRCVVCESQSIDESNAGMARDLRTLVRERIVAGDSDEEIIDYVVSRYGEYVLLAPRMEGGAILLWLAPVIFFAAGGAVVVFIVRQSARAPIEDDGAAPSESAS